MKNAFIKKINSLINLNQNNNNVLENMTFKNGKATKRHSKSFKDLNQNNLDELKQDDSDDANDDFLNQNSLSNNKNGTGKVF